MSLLAGIAATWASPRAAMAARVGQGQREDRAIAALMGAAIVLLVARTPALARAAELDPSVPFQARLGGSMLALLFLMPLLSYALAWVLHLVAGRGAREGARGQGWRARATLFWMLLAIGPAVLAQGLIEGLAGPGALSATTGLLVFLIFVWFLWAGLRGAYGTAANGMRQG